MIPFGKSIVTHLAARQREGFQICLLRSVRIMLDHQLVNFWKDQSSEELLRPATLETVIDNRSLAAGDDYIAYYEVLQQGQQDAGDMPKRRFYRKKLIFEVTVRDAHTLRTLHKKVFNDDFRLPPRCYMGKDFLVLMGWWRGISVWSLPQLDLIYRYKDADKCTYTRFGDPISVTTLGDYVAVKNGHVLTLVNIVVGKGPEEHKAIQNHLNVLKPFQGGIREFIMDEEYLLFQYCYSPIDRPCKDQEWWSCHHQQESFLTRFERRLDCRLLASKDDPNVDKLLPFLLDLKTGKVEGTQLPDTENLSASLLCFPLLFCESRVTDRCFIYNMKTSSVLWTFPEPQIIFWYTIQYPLVVLKYPEDREYVLYGITLEQGDSSTDFSLKELGRSRELRIPSNSDRYEIMCPEFTRSYVLWHSYYHSKQLRMVPARKNQGSTVHDSIMYNSY